MQHNSPAISGSLKSLGSRRSNNDFINCIATSGSKRKRNESRESVGSESLCWVDTPITKKKSPRRSSFDAVAGPPNSGTNVQQNLFSSASNENNRNRNFSPSSRSSLSGSSRFKAERNGGRDRNVDRAIISESTDAESEVNWSRKKDNLLVQAVAKCGDNNWEQVALEIGFAVRPEQCQQRWEAHVNPEIINARFARAPWRRQLNNNNNNNNNAFMSPMSERSGLHLVTRVGASSLKVHYPVPWSRPMEARLDELVLAAKGEDEDQELDYDTWQEIAAELSPQLTGEQCESRWFKIFKSELELPWTAEEDHRLQKFVRKSNSRNEFPSWKLLGEKLGRCRKQCENHWEKLKERERNKQKASRKIQQWEQLPDKKRGRYTGEEDQIIVEFVERWFRNNKTRQDGLWKELEQRLGRKRLQIREHYDRVLKP